ncbi:PREDICTED: killer cell lectin-like receptor subfamily F member 1, partial [Hipposideros armiger]|uniref:Killer cell lectin-like receptor subfamily F member 1 n=1 Tax=Hipposideros armiger TaxID=186990 RepID=A0A8B7QEN2_HIPAR
GPHTDSAFDQVMSFFPSNSKMDYSVYRAFGQVQNTERSMKQKPTKHPYHCQHKWTCKANSRLNLCRNDWVQMKEKFYKFFETFKSWIESQKSCSIMKSHLLMIQDEAELDFVQNRIQDGVYYWIALNITHPQKTWAWLDGTPLNPQLFHVRGQVEDHACAVITKTGVFAEKCHGQSYWICQNVISSDEDL